MPSPTQNTGAGGEARAETALVKLGYLIVERNWLARGGEIDRIAWDGDVLVFVEIRTRQEDDHGYPEDTVTLKKQRRVARAAAQFLMGFSPGKVPAVRFDVVAVSCGRVAVFRDAFEADVLGNMPFF